MAVAVYRVVEWLNFQNLSFLVVETVSVQWDRNFGRGTPQELE